MMWLIAHHRHQSDHYDAAYVFYHMEYLHDLSHMNKSEKIRETHEGIKYAAADCLCKKTSPGIVVEVRGGPTTSLISVILTTLVDS